VAIQFINLQAQRRRLGPALYQQGHHAARHCRRDLGAVYDPGSRPRCPGGGAEEEGVPTAVYYPIPLSKQQAHTHYPSAPTPVGEELARQVIAPPMPLYPDAQTQSAFIEAVHSGL
jgi:hypothetical protein